MPKNHQNDTRIAVLETLNDADAPMDIYELEEACFPGRSISKRIDNIKKIKKILHTMRNNGYIVTEMIPEPRYVPYHQVNEMITDSVELDENTTVYFVQRTVTVNTVKHDRDTKVRHMSITDKGRARLEELKSSPEVMDGAA